MCYFVSSCRSQEGNIGLDKDWIKHFIHLERAASAMAAKDEKYFCCVRQYQYITCLPEQKLILLVGLTDSD